MEKRVDIIIPIYNKENYLKKCLDSISKQTYKKINVLLIDDGSNDNSRQICMNYVRINNNFHYYYKDNGGVSSARNYGISKSNADYIVFVDADDYLDNSFIENLLKYDKDLVICNYITDYKNDYIKYDIDRCSCNNNTKCLEVCLDNKYRYIIATPYIKLFKRSIIEENKIRFNEKMNYGEDTLFVFKYIQYINSIEIINYYGYYNVIEDGTLSRKYIKEIFKQLDLLNKEIKALNVKESYKYNWYLRNYKTILYNERISKYKVFKDTCKYINKDLYFTSIRIDMLTSIQDKIIYILFRLKLYFVIWVLYKSKK